MQPHSWPLDRAAASEMLRLACSRSVPALRPAATRGLAKFTTAPDDLNWSLNKDGVTPSGVTNRNTAPAKGAGAAAGAKKAKATAIGQMHFGDVTAALEAAPELWVYDGEVGTARGSQVGVRIITDLADVASVGTSLVLPVQDNGAWNHERSIIAYAASGTDGAFIGADVDTEGGSAVVLMGGAADVPALKSAIADSAAGLLGAEGGLKYQKPSNGFDILK